MPYQVRWEERGTYNKLWGKCTVGDVIGILQTLAADARFGSLRYSITDYLDVTDSDGTEEDVAEVSALNYAHALSNRRLIRAMVAVEPRAVALANSWIANSETPENLGVFSSVAEAREWVDTMIHQSPWHPSSY